MTLETKPSPPPDMPPAADEASKERQGITWEWLHANIAKALRHVEPGAPLYLTADVLTDELLIPLKDAHHTV